MLAYSGAWHCYKITITTFTLLNIIHAGMVNLNASVTVHILHFFLLAASSRRIRI